MPDTNLNAPPVFSANFRDGSTLYGGDGNDTLRDGDGVTRLFGGNGNDTYIVTSSATYIYDSGGDDTAYVYSDFTKVPDASIEHIIYGPGVKPVPYWVNDLLPDSAAGQNYLALLGPGRTYTYAFPTVAPAYATSESIANFTAFTPAQQTFTRAMLAYISTVADLRFVETTYVKGSNTIAYANSSMTNMAGFSYYPNSSSIGSDVYIDSGDTTFQTPTDGQYSSYLFMHETGHALGLKHPFEDVNHLDPVEDNSYLTVMAYDPDSADMHMKYGDFDIAALQYLYGPSKTARTGDDTYVYNESTSNFIWDGGGNDTIDASSSSKGVTIYLTPGYWGYNGAAASGHITDPGQITVNFGTAIERLIGSRYDDHLYGNDLDNTFQGLGGNDFIDGGKGIDTVIMDSKRADFTLSSNGGTWTVADTRGGASNGADTLVNVERLTFSDTHVALDLAGNAGDVAKVIGAVFGSAAVRAMPDIVGIGLHDRDGGMSYSDLAALALGAVGATTSAKVVATLWHNVVGTTGTAADFAPYIFMLDHGTSVGALATMAADLALNTDRIDLVGLMHTGLEFHA